MVRKVLFLVVALTFLSGLSALSQSGEKAASEKKEISATEINKLIAELGHADFRVREKAMKRLDEIGEAALEPLYAAKKNGNREVSQRAKLLIPAIEWRVLPSKTVSGMQFRLAVDKKWPVSKQGERNAIKIHLEVRNVQDRICRVFPGVSQVKLTDLKGKSFLSVAGSNGSVAAWYSQPLKKNETFSIELDGVITLNRNSIRFWVIDPFDASWCGNNLVKGTYFVSVCYRNHSEYLAGLGFPLWVGEVETFHQKVQIE
jgi:hypothetical protein